MYLLTEGRHGSSDVPQSVMDMMRKGLTAVGATDADTVLRTFAKVTESMEHDDIEQTIRYHLFKLVSEYKYSKIPFLNYVSFLLPRRVGQELLANSKDMMNQFTSPASLDTEIDEDTDMIDVQKSEAECIAALQELDIETLDFLTEDEFRFILDIVERKPPEMIMREHGIEKLRDLQMFAQSIATKIRNLVNVRTG